MSDNTERFVRASDLISAGRAGEAAALLRHILETQPRHLAAARALADIVEAGGAPGDADSARRAALKIEAEATYSVGRTALTHGRFDVALRCYRKVLELDPGHDDATWGLAEACHASGETDEALDWYRRYLGRHPDDAETLHMIAALGGAPRPPRAPDAYVREMFDDFAEDFDRQLLEDLDYRVPRLLSGLCRETAPAGEGLLDMLDVGCGTGLAGVELRALARTLTGVDLSPEMLKLAAARNIYDELAEDGIEAFCGRRAGSFDVVVAADVFCYVGDLSETMAAAQAALRPGGRLVLSVEANDGTGYVLTGSGRYSHAPAYVRRCAAAAGLDEIAGRAAQLRTEYGRPVDGFIAVFRKPS